jgi:hypothetical protein
MKREVALPLLVSVLLILPLAQAQTYSGYDRLTDNIKLFLSSGGSKVQIALEIREKEVDSAIENAENGNKEDAIKNLENAQEKLKIVQEKMSLENSEEIKANVEEIKEKVNKDTLPEEFDKYKLEEEKTQLTAELTLKTFEYCKALAQKDYSLMLKEEKCNPETAQAGLEKELEELKQIQKKSFDQFMLSIRACIDDPGTCNCEDNTDISQKAKCEKMVALAVKCEYKDNEDACDELESLKPVEGDNFAESFVPSFLMDLFKEKQGVIDYNIKKSDVPEECYNENERVKTECAQYRYSKELHSECFDENGKFLVEECGGPKEDTPTMQDSIPQCYDENNQFLTEKCGKVTIIWNEQGLINYIYEEQINEIIENFENASEEQKIDVDGKEGQTMINEMKEEINGLEGQILERTFAPGTEGTGEAKQDIKTVVVDENKGDDGLKPEVKTNIDAGSTEKNEPLPEPDLNKINPDLYDPNARAPGDSAEGGETTYAEGTTAGGTNTIAP